MAAARKLLAVLLLAGLEPALGRAAAGDPIGPLTTAAGVLSLSAEQASRRLPVSVTGIVTAAEPGWDGQFFVQDATGGIFVENLHRPAPAPGDVVAIDGVSHPGAFAPIISAPQWRKLGVAPLPEPRPVPIDDLQTGAEDSQRVEVTGVVRTARLEKGRLLLDLSVTGHRLQVQGPPLPDTPPEALVAARVRVRGTAATHYIGVLRHLTSVAVYVPRPEDLAVVEAAQADPFAEPVIPINRVAQYRRGRRAEQRVHIRGTVTLQRPGREVFLQDDSGGIRVRSAQPDRYAVGDPVEAVGFLEYEGYQPQLADSVLRRLPPAAAPVRPRTVSYAEAAEGKYLGDLVALRGRILDRAVRPDVDPEGNAVGFVTTWLMQGGDTTFTVEYAAPAEDPALAAVPAGSVVEAEGVCTATVDANGKVVSLRLLLPAPGGLRVLERPSWFTPGRLLAGVAVLSGVLVVVAGWLLTMARKNAALHRVVRELEQAQRELQEAHDTLEQKVAERSAQLQVEMTARQEAELEFKAVLAERTRLARDLHDTMEQTLAGIALRLNTAAKLSGRDPAAAEEHLQFARNWLQQSQVDLRRSIWDLRSRELEQFDLARALQHSAEQLAEGTGTTLDFRTEGDPQRLPEVVEENVLRIAQEALTNIAKHARATRVGIRLAFEARRLRLHLEDNGVGFDPAHTPDEGHFGLTGMAERVKRLAGRLDLASAPGRGTTLTVEIPLPSAEAQLAADARPEGSPAS